MRFTGAVARSRAEKRVAPRNRGGSDGVGFKGGLVLVPQGLKLSRASRFGRTEAGVPRMRKGGAYSVPL